MNTAFRFSRPFLSAVALLGPVLLLMTAFGCRTTTNTNNENTTINESTNTVIPVNTSVINSAVLVNTNSGGQTSSSSEQQLVRLVNAFAERYGSYSNQTDYENLEALLVFMTPGFEKTTSAYIKAERAKNRDTTIYYGITARVVTTSTTTFDEGKGIAVFLVSTMRKETIGSNGNVKSFQQDLLVTMRKDGDAWKIDQASWQGKR